VSNKRLYKVTTNIMSNSAGSYSANGMYFADEKEVFHYMSVVMKAKTCNSDELTMAVTVTDQRTFVWDNVDYQVQSHFKYNKQKWIEAGMPESIVKDASEEELVQ